MGFTPSEVDAMSLWEYQCCMAGHNRAQGGENTPSSGTMSDERMAELGIEGFDVE